MKHLDLKTFEELFQNFICHPTWTKLKHQAKKELTAYLKDYQATTISVKANSKYNYCRGTDTFTILKVPDDTMGKLSKYRGMYVLIRCSSYFGKGWTQYLNEVYLLDTVPTQDDIDRLNKTYGDFFVHRQLHTDDI